jgi:hypothetical protein
MAVAASLSVLLPGQERMWQSLQYEQLGSSSVCWPVAALSCLCWHPLLAVGAVTVSNPTSLSCAWQQRTHQRACKGFELGKLLAKPFMLYADSHRVARTLHDV